MSKLLRTYSNLLQSKEELETCENILRGFGWKFGFKSDISDNLTPLPKIPNYNDYNIPFWKLPLENEPFFTKHMFSIVEERTQMKFDIMEVYCNGQTYGQDGCPHIDNVYGETHTFLYYANQDWNLTSGGQTVFLVDGNRVGIDPRPNSAILFSTDLIHYGEAFNQTCRDLRMTVCYKLKLK